MTTAIRSCLLYATIFFLPICVHGQCSETGSHSGTAFSNDASTGNFPFSNPANVLSTDNNRASATALFSLLSGNTNVLKASGFGFAIPASAAICGIKVELEKSATGINIFAWVSDESVRLTKGGNSVGSNKALSNTWSTTEAYSTYGGTTDQWGTSWTPADINDPSFGIAFSAHITGLISLLPSARVDHVSVTVYYNLVLPVAIERFEAKPGSDHSATLHWTFGDIHDLQQWSIQRKTLRSEWSIIHSQEINEDKWSSSVYGYSDKNCIENEAHYRLAIQTMSGNTEYSKTVTVKWEAGKIQLYPNPASTHLFIQGKQKGITVTCINTSGQQFVLPMQNAGRDIYKVDIEKLPAGTWCIGMDGQWKLIQKR